MATPALAITSTSPCPCNSGQTWPDCCGQYLEGRAAAPTAEALMRSRYSAYVLHAHAYLFETWHASTRPSSLNLDEPAVRWLGLKVVDKRAGGPGDAEGYVEFVARYKINGKAERLHENSRFLKEDNHWFYLDAET